jgi:RHS repeat-associated protein
MTGSGACVSEVCFPRSRFTGKERDSESGNDYFGARHYSSAMGRWMSPDWSAKAERVPYSKLDNPAGGPDLGDRSKSS